MAEPKVLSRDDIRSAAMQAQIATEPMTVPELGGVIYVRGMSGKERDKTEETYRQKNGGRQGRLSLRNYRAFMACRVIVDAQGNRLLNDDDADVIGRLPVGVLDRIINKSTELSGGTEEELADLGNDSASGAASGGSASNSHSS